MVDVTMVWDAQCWTPRGAVLWRTVRDFALVPALALAVACLWYGGCSAIDMRCTVTRLIPAMVPWGLCMWTTGVHDVHLLPSPALCFAAMLLAFLLPPGIISVVTAWVAMVVGTTLGYCMGAFYALVAQYRAEQVVRYRAHSE